MKIKKTVFLLILVIAITFSFSGCITEKKPVIEDISNQIAKTDKEFIYQVVAYDPNNGELTYTLKGEPEGMQISSTGLISWTPGQDQTGIYDIEIEAINGIASSFKQFTITVVTVYLESITVNPPSMVINKGQSATIHSITAYYDDDSSADVGLDACTYQSNVSSVTVIDGVISVSSACGVPSAKITVSYSEGEVTRSSIVNVFIPGGGG